MYNPFQSSFKSNADEQELIIDALKGRRNALEKLIKDHQGWIYNIALRMTADFPMAEDVTQEILIKIITKLSTYDPQKAGFKTWVYRIVANHVISMKRKGESIMVKGGFHKFAEHIDEVPLEEIPDDSPYSQEAMLLIEESRNGCMTGMLLCFKPRQRLVYILGEIFNVSSQDGAKILDIDPANFRQILARARKQLAQFMEKNCGLVYPQAKCKCKSKVMPQIKRGMIQPGNLKFSQQVEKIKQLVGKKKISTKLMIEKDIKTLYQDHPFYRPEDKTMIVKKVLAKP